MHVHLLLPILPLFPTNSISALALAKNSLFILDAAEQVMVVPLRSAVALLVDIVETSGRGQLLFNNFETFRVVKAVIIGVTI